MKQYLKYEMGKFRQNDKIVWMSFQPELLIMPEYKTAIAYLQMYDVVESVEDEIDFLLKIHPEEI